MTPQSPHVPFGERYFRALVENAEDIITVIDREGVVRYESPALERLLGFRPSDLVGQSAFDLVHPEDVPAARRAFQAVLAASGATAALCVRAHRKDGSWCHVEGVARNLLHDPDVAGVVVNARDVSARRRAEQEHAELLAREREARERLTRQTELAAAVTRSVGEGVCVVDRAGRLTFLNPAAERLLGWSAAEVAGKSLHNAVHFQHADGTPARPEDCPLLRVIQGEAAAAAVEDVLTRKDGRTIPVALRATPVLGPSGVEGAVVAFRDLSDQRLLEAKYLQAQKMEAVGRLAGGVAHDFNNLLTVINGFGEMLLDDLSADDPRRDLVRQITVAGGRAASLTRQLLAFTRRQRIAPEILDLRAVLAETAPMLRRLIGEDVALTVASDADLGSVRADSTQVVQVLLNLAVNARDAMPHGGRLTVEARNAWLDHHPNESHPAGGAGPHVLMAVTDTGCGMTPAVAARAFEPFFTTKEPGKGTGLGLAVVHDIVTWAGGHVEIHSEPGAGTTFRLYFPRAWERPAAGKPQGGPAELPRGDETVLLVEDDDAVRTVASHVLRSCGYRLLEAADGADGLRAAEAHGGRIDLLVADVVLPNMGGPALAERLAAGRPGMRVLFLSGYPEGPVPRDVALGAEAAFLEKPFSPATLARRVREVLERR